MAEGEASLEVTPCGKNQRDGFVHKDDVQADGRVAYMKRSGKKATPSKFRVTVIIEEFQTPELKTVSGSKGFWAELGALLKRLIIACGIQSFWRILW